MARVVIRDERPSYQTVARGLFMVSVAAILASCGGASGSGAGSKAAHQSLSSLIISPANAVVAIGDNERFAATGYFADGSKQDMTSAVAWSSADSAIAPIDTSGRAVAKQPGTTTILAVSGSITATTILTVPSPTLVSVSIVAPDSPIPKGGTEQLAARGTLSDGSTKDLTSVVTWATSAPAIAAVSPAGVVTGATPGTATITATSGRIRGAQMFTIAQPMIVSLAIAPSTLSLPKGRTQQLSVIGSFSDGSTQDVTASVAWTMSPASIAAINNSGLVSTLATGTTTLTAISGSVSASATLSVLPPVLTSLAITPSSPLLAKGNTQQLTVTGTLSDGGLQNLTSNVTWTVSPGNVLAVSNSGMVSALINGAGIVTATSGTLSATDTITVSAATLVSMAISPPNPSVIKGQTQQLNVSGTFSDGSKRDLTGSATWTVSPVSVAAVSATGLVTTLATGTGLITAASGSVSATDVIMVSPVSLASIAISPANPSLPKGETQQLAATGTYNDGSTQDLTSQVTWSGSASTVATVNSTGLITAQAAGKGTITAALGSISGTDTVTVVPPVVVSIAVTPVKSSVTETETEQLHATGTFSDGSKQNLTQTATWTAAQSGIATISSSGLVTAGQPGTTTISATSGTVTGTATLKVLSAVLVSISITPNNPSIPLGSSGQLQARGNYNDGTTQDLTQQVTWASLQPNIATISSAGVDAGKQQGTVMITATLGSVSGFIPLTVTAPVLISLSVTPVHPYLPIAGSVQLTAVGMFSDQSTHSITNQVAWSASTVNIVTVSNAGIASAKAPGIAVVTASSGQFSATTNIIVSDASINIVPANPAILMGSGAQLRAIATFTDGSTADITSSVTWTVADPTVAAITSDGHALSEKVGSTAIAASSGPASGAGTLTVLPIKVLDYFDNAQQPGVDQTLRLSNSGNNDLCALVYVFTADQQMSECCGCHISRNGLRTLSLNTDLTANPLTGQFPKRGTVDVVPADATSNPTCDPTSFTPAGAVTMWATHIQNLATASFVVTEDRSRVTSLSNADLPTLQGLCGFVNTQGSGQGTCTCGTGD